MHPAARLFFSSAPFFHVCGGDKHPAAHVFNPEQARLERAFVCWGGCFSAAFPCAPFQRWQRASCRTWASSFFSAVASSNLPRSTSYTKNKQCASRSLACVRACVRVCMCSHTQRRSFSCHFQTNVISFKSEVGGAKQNGAEAPHREAKPSAQRQRTARTTRQINGANPSEAMAI